MPVLIAHRERHRRVANMGQYDPDALNYFNAASIVDATERNAANTLIKDLKGYGLWDLITGLYLISPTSLAAAAVNAKTPGTFNITWVNSPTLTSTGVDFNGTTQYGRTGIIPDTHLTTNNVHLSYYSREDIAEASHVLGCGGAVPANNSLHLVPEWSNNLMYFNSYNTGQHAYAVGVSTGHFLGSRRTATDTEIYRNGSSLETEATGGGTPPSVELYIGALNNNGAPSAYSTRQCAFASVGLSMTDAQAANFYTAVQAYQTSLSRQV